MRDEESHVQRSESASYVLIALVIYYKMLGVTPGPTLPALIYA
jgi:hypothetical protein